MADGEVCPKCGTRMSEQPLTDSEGLPVRFGGTGEESGSLISMVCPGCGYAELRAAREGEDAPHATPDDAASPGDTGDLASIPAIAELPPEAQAALMTALGAAGEHAGAGPTGRRRTIVTLTGALTDLEPKPVGPGMLVAFAFTAMVTTAGVVMLYLAAGPVMELGGMVALGGPYEIAHPAPDWIPWPMIMFVLGIFAFFGNLIMAMSYNRPNLVLPFWAALFGLQGYNFLYFGFNAPGGGRDWTWIVLGIVFVAMALPAVLLMLVPETWRGFRGAFGIATLTGVVLGVVGAVWLFGVITAV